MSVVIGACVSLVCSLVLIWFLNPKWQSLHNFISIHQIIFGTLHLWSLAIRQIWTLDWISEDTFFRIHGYLFLAFMGWSTVVAYLKLVLLETGKVVCEKRKAAAFTYGIVIIVKAICEGTVPNVLKPTSELEALAIAMLSVYTLMSVNFFIFLNMVRSVISCNKSIASRRGKRVISLLGIAILCDITTLTSLNLILVVVNIDSYVDFLFHYRLIIPTLVILFNRTSKEYWKKRKELIKLRKFSI